jgi:hypothetical protein
MRYPLSPRLRSGLDVHPLDELIAERVDMVHLLVGKQRAVR